MIFNMEKTKMNIKEASIAYEPKGKTLNIAELEKIPINLELQEETHTDKKGKAFSIKVFEYNGNKYRLPATVLEGLKAILSKLPDTKFFSVLKQGQGMNTSYQVIPVNDPEQIKIE